MVVLTTAEVERVLRNELAAHGSRRRGSKTRLVRFDLTVSGHAVTTWGAGASQPTYIVEWRDLWTALDGCGRPWWPQMVRIPLRLLPHDGIVPHLRILALLRQAAQSFDSDDVEMISLEPNGEGAFRVAVDIDGNTIGTSAGNEEAAEDRRQIVFVDANAFT